MKRVLVIGSGFFGATIAQLCADSGAQVLILEKRETIGGNAYTYNDSLSSINIHKYGTHIFHTSNENVWKYVNQFGQFNNYQHKVISKVKTDYYDFPINLKTYSDILGITKTPNEMNQEIESIRKSFADYEISNLQQKAISLVGEKLYELFIEGYTRKQWGIDPRLLPADIITRIPVYFDFENRYFTDKFQGIPVGGYTEIIKEMLANRLIDVSLSSDFFDGKHLPEDFDVFVFTGAIDQFFNYDKGQLNWRTLDFEFEHLTSIENFQGVSVMNFPDSCIPYTRIHEFKHLHPERISNTKGTVIAREYSRAAERDDEPYYPVRLRADLEVLDKYRYSISRLPKNWFFGGRLGSYRYLDMHMAIGSAISLFNGKIAEILRAT